MSRPKYETEENLNNEEDVKQIIEYVWTCECKKLPTKDVLDFAMCRNGRVEGWLEIKCRKISFKNSHDYMISLYKIKEARELVRETNLPFFLVVKFTDGLYYYKDEGETHRLNWGGRFKTARDSQDQEPCYYININLFTKIE